MSANICFIARPRTPARMMFPATDPVNEDSTSIIDLVTKESANEMVRCGGISPEIVRFKGTL